ncbi:MAG: Na+/H+ antiporter NhaC [Pseudomonadales bacterium]|nr:Na+/H+ antiporter NhaC [Pseudomonadales bacterium]
MTNSDNHIRSPMTAMAVMPLLALVVMLGGSIYLFGDGTTGGPAQVALIIAGVLAGGVGVLNGHSWKSLETGAAKSIQLTLPAIFIVLMVGTLIGLWMLAGTIPYITYYGLQLLAPEIFYIAAVLLSAIVAISIGSSWTTAGTVGLSLVGIASASGLSVEVTAGAVISGAYFGDKLSPLSDTTNLAAAVTATELFEHIRFLLWTTVPAILIALVVFGYFSLTSAPEIDQSRIDSVSRAILENYNLNPIVMLPLVVTLILAGFQKPAFVSLSIGAATGAVIAAVMQPQIFGQTGNALETIWRVAANGYTANTGNPVLDDLLSRGGMESMLNTIWLIISAMFFGGMMEKSGALSTLVRYLMTGVNSVGGLMRRAGMTSLAANLVTSDQYLAIALPSRMYADIFEEKNLKTKNLSRVLEDFGTVTSVLVPWNTCGAFMAATLGVATGDYLIFCIFNIASPVISYLYALFNFKIEYKGDSKLVGQPTGG